MDRWAKFDTESNPLRTKVMTTFSVDRAIERIGSLARNDPGQRGFAALAGQGDLLRATTALLPGKRIIIVTGFCIRAAMIGENDGLSGSLALADALRQLGKEVVLVADRHSTELLEAAAILFGEPFQIESLPQDQTVADREIDALLTGFRPTQVVAIERPGSGPDGHRYSMRGELLDDLVPAADRLLVPPFPRNYETIAIGDGGNELGLGGLRGALKDHVALGDLIFCATPADYVIPAGVSNWGAHALVAALSLTSARLLAHPPGRERAVLEALLTAGAVDGSTRKRELTVDGIGWNEYAEILTAMYREITNNLTPD